MRIDGRKIAEEIRSELKKEINKLKDRGVVPKIAIITLGDESSWEVYVRQKIKTANEMDIKTVLLNLADADEQTLIKTIETINRDKNYHGIIVQRPLPSGINRTKVVETISAEKDIDGFRSDSNFEVPVWMAVRSLLLYTRGDATGGPPSSTRSEQSERGLSDGGEERQDPERLGKVIVIGKGETAGKPVIEGLRRMGVNPEIIDSQTQNRSQILKNADVVISCVGKPNIVKADELKSGVLLIGVGIRGEEGKAKGDYEESAVEQVASAYTPTPGGVGPVNLSYLFYNLIKASSKTT